MKNPKRPKDANQRAKSIVDIATGDAEESNPNEGKDQKIFLFAKFRKLNFNARHC